MLFSQNFQSTRICSVKREKKPWENHLDQKQSTKIRSYIKTRLAADQEGWRVWIGAWNKRNKLLREIEGLSGKLRPRQAATNAHHRTYRSCHCAAREGRKPSDVCCLLHLCRMENYYKINYNKCCMCVRGKYLLVITQRVSTWGCGAGVDHVLYEFVNWKVYLWILWGLWLIRCLNKFLQSVKVNTLRVNLFCLLCVLLKNQKKI